jgi:hypothetical protein
VAQAGPPKPAVPGAIEVRDGNKVFLVGHGVGVHTYSCNGVVWSFFAARANLYADNGTLIIPQTRARDREQAHGRLSDAAAQPLREWLVEVASVLPIHDDSLAER